MFQILIFLGIFFFFAASFLDVKKVFLYSPLFWGTIFIRTDIRGIPFSVCELLYFALAVSFLVQLMYKKELRHMLCMSCISWKDKLASPLFWTLVFGGIATLSLFVVPKETLFQTGIVESPVKVFESLKIALGIWKGWILPCMLFMFFATLFASEKKDRDMLVHGYVSSAVFLVLVGVCVQYILGWQSTLDGRFGGVFVSANYLVFYVVPAFLLSLTQLRVGWKNPLIRWPYIVAAVLLVGAIFLARSYASWILLMGMAGVYALISLPKVWKYTVGGMLIVVLLGAVFFEMRSEKGKTFFETQERSSTSVRLEVYKISWELIRRQPLTGIGMGQYEAQYAVHAHDILGKPPYEWVMLHPHNLYVSLWLSLGIVGLFWILGLLKLIVWRIWGTKNFLAALPLLYVLLHGFVDTPFWKLDAMLIFFLLLFLFLSETKALAKPTKIK